MVAATHKQQKERTNMSQPKPDDEKQSEHNAGQKDGANATITGQIIHELIGQAFHSNDYNAGWENGVDNKPTR